MSLQTAATVLIVLFSVSLTGDEVASGQDATRVDPKAGIELIGVAEIPGSAKESSNFNRA